MAVRHTIECTVKSYRKITIRCHHYVLFCHVFLGAALVIFLYLFTERALVDCMAGPRCLTNPKGGAATLEKV